MDYELDSIYVARNIVKEFPGVRALNGVDFDLKPGEVHALLGENGAGKSTLVKILSGVYHYDEGELILQGEEVKLSSPIDALEKGIACIYQELSLAPHLDVATNMYLGRFPSVGGFVGESLGIVNWKKVYKDAKEKLAELHIDVNPRTIASHLPASKAQMVEIARALSMNSKIVIMDEPTSSLSLSQQEELFTHIRRLKSLGISIIYISHRLEEICEISDRITVLRDGNKIGTITADCADVDILANMIVGRDTTERYPKAEANIRETILEVKNLSRKGVLQDINFSLRRGEILGVSGLVGSGRTELARALFGADPIDSGEVYIEGEKVVIKSTADAMDHGMAFLTEDRKNQGLLLRHSVLTNISTAAVNCLRVVDKYISSKRFLKLLNYKELKKSASEYVDVLALKAPSLQTTARELSGGNQQKVVIAKWLMTSAQIFLFDEPTRGIDVGTKAEVYKLMQKLAQEGAGIIMISSEMPEVLEISDRILVMSRGAIVAEVYPADVNQELLLKYASTAPKLEAIPG